MCQDLRFGFRMGVIPINAFQVCLKSLLNFHGENLVAFCLIFMVEIRQRIASDVSQHFKRYSHQAFNVRIWQQGYPIFKVKICQSFVFGVLWHTDRVSILCIQCVSTCSHCDESKPSKVLDHTDMCRIHRETNVTWCYGSRQSYCNDRAHNIA